MQIASVNMCHVMLYVFYIYIYSYLDVGQTIGFPKSTETPPRFGLFPKLSYMPAGKMPFHLHAVL